jgi:hypothetical protein
MLWLSGLLRWTARTQGSLVHGARAYRMSEYSLFCIYFSSPICLTHFSPSILSLLISGKAYKV